MSRFLLRYGLVLTVAWLLLMVVARALGGSVGGQEWILYLSNRVLPDLRLLDPNRRITVSLDEGIGYWSANSSADRRYIAYQVNTQGGGQHCVVRDLFDGARLRYQSPTAINCTLYWSSDGTRILFDLNHRESWTLVSLDLATDEQRQLQVIMTAPDDELVVIGDVRGPLVSFHVHDGTFEGRLMQADLETGRIWETGLVGQLAVVTRSADGRWSAFQLFQNDQSILHLLDAHTGELSVIDETLTAGSLYHWYGDRLMYMPLRSDSDVYRIFHPATRHYDVIYGRSQSLLLAPDGQHLALNDDGVTIQRWDEPDQEWRVVYQQPQPVDVLRWIDAQTLAGNVTHGRQTVLWLYDTETASRWELSTGVGQPFPMYWTPQRDHFLLHVITPDSKSAVLAVNRATNVITTLIAPSHNLNGLYSETASSIRLFDAGLSGAPLQTLQVNLADLRVQPVQTSVHDWNSTIFQNHGPYPKAIAFRTDATGSHDLYLLDTEHAQITPLMITPNVDEYTALWVYPAPP